MLRIPVTATDHIQGDLNAPLVLVEYGDYECPHCGHAYFIVKRLQKHFGNKLAFVFRNFPLNEIHPEAEIAAESAEFAATKDRFWEMHDAIFENQAELSAETLVQFARQLELPTGELEAAWSNQTYRNRVRADFDGGVRSGVNGTPTFFINGRRHEGRFELEDLIEAIAAAQTG
jgi:protein-disulfide isomerase